MHVRTCQKHWPPANVFDHVASKVRDEGVYETKRQRNQPDLPDPEAACHERLQKKNVTLTYDVTKDYKRTCYSHVSRSIIHLRCSETELIVIEFIQLNHDVIWCKLSLSYRCELGVVKGLLEAAVHRYRDQQQLVLVLQVLSCAVTSRVTSSYHVCTISMCKVLCFVIVKQSMSCIP